MVGLIIAGVLALLSAGFTALLLVSAFNALREVLWPDFRRLPPGPAGLGLTLLGFALPALLTALLTAYLAVWLLRVIAAAS